MYQGGLLTGKYRRGAAPPAGSRATASGWLDGKIEDAALAKVELFEKVAAKHGLSLFDYSVRRTAATPGITSLIIGVTRIEQLEAAVSALGGARTAMHVPKL